MAKKRPSIGSSKNRKGSMRSPTPLFEVPATFEVRGYKFGGFGTENPDAKLAGVDLSGKEMVASVLTRADLKAAKLDSAGLSGAELVDADLSNASLVGSYLVNARLAGAKFVGAVLRGADLSQVNLSYVEDWDDDGEIFERLHTPCNFEGADLSGASLRSIRGFRSSFARATLNGADLSSQTFLFDGDVDPMNLLSVLDEANFDAASMTNVSLVCARLRAASLRRAVLRGADLSGADLTDADLTDADLTGALLFGGRLKWEGSGTQHDRAVKGARLAGAKLSGAILVGVDLAGVDLTDVDLRRAILRDDLGSTDH